jgi:hypothetical protein
VIVWEPGMPLTTSSLREAAEEVMEPFAGEAHQLARSATFVVGWLITAGVTRPCGSWRSARR